MEKHLVLLTKQFKFVWKTKFNSVAQSILLRQIKKQQNLFFKLELNFNSGTKRVKIAKVHNLIS